MIRRARGSAGHALERIPLWWASWKTKSFPTLERARYRVCPALGPRGKGAIFTGKIDERVRHSTLLTSLTPGSPLLAREPESEPILSNLSAASLEAKESNSLAQVAPAWLLRRKPWIVPIPARPRFTGSRRTSERHHRAHRG